MSDHGLRAGDHQAVRMPPKGPPDRPGLDRVVVEGARPVGVDIVHILSLDATLAQRERHRPSRPFAVLFGRRDVKGIIGGPIALHLSVNLRPTRLGVAERLEQQSACPLGHHERPNALAGGSHLAHLA